MFKHFFFFKANHIMVLHPYTDVVSVSVTRLDCYFGFGKHVHCLALMMMMS